MDGIEKNNNYRNYIHSHNDTIKKKLQFRFLNGFLPDFHQIRREE